MVSISHWLVDNFSMQEPLVSVVIPAYRCKDFILQAVDSVLKQTYKNLEVIVVEDHSEDGTLEFLNENCVSPKVRIVANPENIGVGFTRERGVQLANGNYVAFLDSDDLWEPEKLSHQMHLLLEEKADLVFTGSRFIDLEGNDLKGLLEAPDKVTYKRLLRQNVISCSSVLMRKDVFQKYGMAHDEAHEDYLLWLRLLKDGHTALGINEPLIRHRLAPKSKSGNKLKSARMTMKVFRLIGLNIFQRVFYFCCYALNGIRKYKGIKG